MTDAREKIIEAMARAFCDEVGEADEIVTVYTFEKGEHQSVGWPLWKTMVPRAETALAAIAEQGYAVVPERVRGTYWQNSADIARPDPAREAKP